MAYRRHVVLEDSASVGRQWRWRRRLASTRLHDKVWPPRSRVCACVRVAVHTCVSHEGTGCACVRACVCKRACRACVRAHMRAGLCEGVNAQGTHRHPGAVGDRWTKRAMEATPSSGWQSWVHRRRRETTASMRDAGLRGARGVAASGGARQRGRGTGARASPIRPGCQQGDQCCIGEALPPAGAVLEASTDVRSKLARARRASPARTVPRRTCASRPCAVRCRVPYVQPHLLGSCRLRLQGARCLANRR